jgi:hypothetical protein
MRTGRRFTPALLEKWYDAGRGSGTGATYQPWHQVTRSDPGSRGRSHLINWRFGRLHHLLSDQELLAFGFASMWPGLLDLREQFPLEHDEHVVELAAYRADQITRLTPGTTEIANDLGLKHPVLRSGGVALPWVMSTDLLLTYAAANGRTELLAVSVKHDDELKVPRTRELLAIEREYWRRQDVYWLLISPSLYTRDVAASVLAGMPWWVGQPCMQMDVLEACVAIKCELNHLPLSVALSVLSRRLDMSIFDAQCVFWQAIWRGMLHVDLSRPVRPSSPLILATESSFWAQNPIVSRRTAWRV